MQRKGADDRYRFQELLGSGGAGSVWRVEDRLFPGSVLALKELTASGEVDPAREQDLRREFAALASLHHPNLVEVYDFDRSREGLPRFTLELVQGVDIVEAVRREGPELLMTLAAEALRALAFLHDFDLIHRDLKPANLLVRDRTRLDCRLVIVDFGLARLAGDEPLEAFRAKGTLPYLAPELFRNRPASARSDLYSLAAVLHEAIFDAPPVRLKDDNLGNFIQAVVEGKRRRPELPDSYPPGLGRWLDGLLSPDPGLRPASAREALARLNEACQRQYPTETPTTRAARLRSGRPEERKDVLARLWSSLTPRVGPRVVWIAGAPGFGKTRLLRWLAAEGVLEGWRVVSGQGGETSTSLDELRKMASERPTLLLLDDLDTAGTRTAELVDRVAREPHQPALQVVAAVWPRGVRHPALSKLWNDTGTVPTLARIELGSLDENGIRAMASRATGASVADERVRWLLETSDGVPAVVESLLVEGAWERRSTGTGAAAAEGSAGARYQGLSPEAGRWLDALAVWRGRAGSARVAALAGLEEEAAAEAAREVAAIGLAYRSIGQWRAESRRWVEQHLARMDARARRELNLRAAKVLREQEGEGAEAWLLARLWHGAGERARAIDCAAEAARQTARAGDPALAAEQYGAALRWLRRSREGRYGLRLRQGDALMECGMHQDAVRAFGSAVRFATTAAERDGARALQAEALVHAGRFQRALSTASALSERTRELDGPTRIRAGKAAAIALGRLGREPEAVPLLAEAQKLAQDLADREAEAELLQLLATCKLRARMQGAEEDFLRAVELYGSLAPPEGRRDAQELKARIGLAVIRARRGEYDLAERELDEVRQVALEQGQLSLQEKVRSQQAMVAFERGRLDDAARFAEEAADLALHLGDPNLVLVNHCRLGEAKIRCGSPGEAVALMRETLSRPLNRAEPENVDYARMLLAEAWMESGGGDEAGIASLMEQTLTRCRRLRKMRTLLMGLAIEMKRRARPECGDPFDPVSDEFDAASERAGASVDAEIVIRAAIARTMHRLRRGDALAATASAAEAAELAAERAATAFEAEAQGLLAEASARLGMEEEAERARDRGRARLAEAARRIGSDEARDAFVRRPVFAPLARRDILSDRHNHGRLVALYDMIRALNSETETESLLETILDMALRVVGAERGMILLKSDETGAGREGEFAVHVARSIDAETVKDAESYSRHVVQQAGAGRSLLAIDAAEDERFRELKSVSLYNIRSLMCVPLRSRGKIIGTVYLDSRREGVLFTENDLRFLEAFADHAALALENVFARTRLELQNRRLQAAAETRTRFANIVGRSPAMQNVFSLIEAVASSNLPVLIQGESGTGKELVARAIHFQGTRRRRPLVLENCSAVPASLLESELFGHVRGAFTGAERDHPGLFEQAHLGTLFLDEIGDMSSEMQARLLRVLETGKIRRVGGERPITVDVRIVAATHRDLEEEARAGRFREDLLYRLQVVTIELPPLRDRPGDVSLLAEHFLRRIAEERARDPVRVDDDVLALFEEYAWPGNVRQLENTLRRLTLLGGGRPITRSMIEADPKARAALLPEGGGTPRLLSLKLAEKEQVRRALERAGGNRRRAAALLSVSRATLYRKLKEHGLS
jgi:transcriptional regulator with GAF, ATPase, and Fis domain